MFGWFKRKPTQSPLLLPLELDDAEFIEVVASSTTSGPPASGAMCIVAYQNLQPMMQAAFKIARETGKSDLPSNLDDFIRFIVKSLDEGSDDIGKRRLLWLYHAALILRATRLGESNPQVVDGVAEIWRSLAIGGSVLANSLKHNVLWSDNEKEYFSHITNSMDGIEYVVCILAPRYIRRHSTLQAFADEHDIFVGFDL